MFRCRHHSVRETLGVLWLSGVTTLVSCSTSTLNSISDTSATDAAVRADTSSFPPVSEQPAAIRAKPTPRTIALGGREVSIVAETAVMDGTALGAGPWRWDRCAAWPDERCRVRERDGHRAEFRSLRRGVALAWRLDRAPRSGATIHVPWTGIQWQQAGQSLHGTDAAGRVWWHGPAQAWDAAGRSVQTEVHATASGVDIELGLSEAVFPVTIDPVVQTAEWTWSGTQEGIHGAGDLDDDGHDEVVIFSRGGTTTSVGEVTVFPGTASGPDTSAAVYLSPAGATWEFGRSASAAGDVNGDGFGDLVVGGGGTAWIWLGGAAGISATPDITLSRPTGSVGTGFGFAVSSAGDVDADGYDDVLVSDPTADAQTGSVWLFRGGAAGTETSPTGRWDGQAAVDWFGISVAPAGDVDADGHDDVIIGAANAAGITGYAATFHGTSSGLTAAAMTTVWGAGAGATLGRSVDGAGDVDQDGYDDVVIGIPGERAAHGAVALHRGGPDGVETSAVSTLDGLALGAKLGTSVSGAGDVNGDGHPDVVGGSPAVSASFSLWYGNDTGLTQPAATTVVGSMTFGKWLDGGMDIDGDGYSDVVVSDPGARIAGWFPGGPDGDGDGFPAREDCDDTDPLVGAAEWWWPDGDGDGWGDDASGQLTCTPAPDDVPTGGDCDDDNAAVSPDGIEYDADGVDGDCDGLEACHVDADGDGARTEALLPPSDDVRCLTSGHATADAPLDCDDQDPTVAPSATELCDGRDGNCDGRVDHPPPADAPTWFLDADGDGHGAGAPVMACEPPAGHVSDSGDCEDNDPSVSPDATEIPDDGVDQDCDGADQTSDSTEPDETPDRKPTESGKTPSPTGCAVLPTQATAATLLAAMGWLRRRRT